MRLVVVGFPKSGTTTLHESLTASGLRSVHWTYLGAPVGQLIYQGLLHRGDPFHHLRRVDAVTQMDYCMPKQGLNFWPNLDFSVLHAIRRQYPDCLMVLNRRDPQAIAQSIFRWGDMAARIRDSDVPGLPAGFGGSEAQLVRWIESHFAAVQAAFGKDPRFLDLDIASPDAPVRLGAALGIELRWWGVANRNPPSGAAEQAALQDETPKSADSAEAAAGSRA